MIILKIETQSNLTKSNLFSSTSGLSHLRTLGNERKRERERERGREREEKEEEERKKEKRR